MPEALGQPAPEIHRLALGGEVLAGDTRAEGGFAASERLVVDHLGCDLAGVELVALVVEDGGRPLVVGEVAARSRRSRLAPEPGEHHAMLVHLLIDGRGGVPDLRRALPRGGGREEGRVGVLAQDVRLVGRSASKEKPLPVRLERVPNTQRPPLSSSTASRPFV